MNNDTLADYWRDVSPILKQQAQEKNKEDLEFIKNASKEEKIARKIETLSHNNINSACLSICGIYGLSGLCGVECPNYNKCEYAESKGE